MYPPEYIKQSLNPSERQGETERGLRGREEERGNWLGLRAYGDQEIQRPTCCLQAGELGRQEVYYQRRLSTQLKKRGRILTLSLPFVLFGPLWIA